MTGKALDWIKTACAALGGVAAYLWGPWDALIIALIGLVAIDYITGIVKAALLKQLDSAVGFRGLMKKVFIFALVALASIVDKIVPATNQAVRSAVILFYIVNEGLSILENAGELGLPLPGALKSALTRLSGSEKVSQNNAKEIDQNK